MVLKTLCVLATNDNTGSELKNLERGLVNGMAGSDAGEIPSTTDVVLGFDKVGEELENKTLHSPVFGVGVRSLVGSRLLSIKPNSGRVVSGVFQRYRKLFDRKAMSVVLWFANSSIILRDMTHLYHGWRQG